MHIIEDSDNKEKTQLKLWRTESDKVYIEMAPEDEPDCVYSQFMTLDIEDSRALAEEILRIVHEIEMDQYYDKLDQQQAKSQANASNLIPVGNKVSNVSNGNITHSSQEKQGSVIPDGKNGKKKTGGEIHARYTKDESGQLQIITAK